MQSCNRFTWGIAQGFRSVFFLGFVILFVSADNGSERNPRIGTWKLNLDKSTFNDGPAPKSEVQVCESVDENTIRLKIIRADARGHESRREYTAHYDGKDYPFPGSPWDTIALRRIDRLTSEAVFKKTGKVVQRSTITVSKDGRMLTLRATAPHTAGNRVTHIEVFDRQ